MDKKTSEKKKYQTILGEEPSQLENDPMSRVMKYAIPFVVGGIIGMFGGMYLMEPDSVYVRDINKDNRSDVVIKNKNNNLIPYIQQKDGEYISLEELKQLEKEVIEEETESIKENLKGLKE